MPSLVIESPQAAWGSLYSVHEPVKPPHVLIPAAAARKPAYGVGRKNLETCTEALGCETGAVDTAPRENGFDGDDSVECLEAECAEKKRPARGGEEEAMAGRVRRSERRGRPGPLPPPLTTLGTCRVQMVHERHDGRLEVYAVRMSGVLEAERSGGRLRMRLLPLPCRSAVSAAASCCPQERQGPEAKETKQDEEEISSGFSKYVRGGRCVGPEDGAAAARPGNRWELELRQFPCIF